MPRTRPHLNLTRVKHTLWPAPPPKIMPRPRPYLNLGNLTIAVLFGANLFWVHLFLITKDGEITATGGTGGDINTFTAPVDVGLSITRTSSQNGTASTTFTYIPASIEQYIMEHLSDLNVDNGHDRIASEAEYDWDWPDTSSGCDMWKDRSVTSDSNYERMHEFRKELHEYYKAINARKPLPDVRLEFDHAVGSDARQDITCKALDVHPNGLHGIFQSHQLSLTKSGYVEPLLPPMRHPDFCFDQKMIMSLEYLVHDFSSMCRNLKKHSRIVLVDMGASLSFGDDANGELNTPVLYLAYIFEKFGLPFDHIYAYKIEKEDPEVVMNNIPPNRMAAWHWINVGVSTDINSTLNPLRLILDNYNAEDLIIVKMDIDNAAEDMETPLAGQMLKDPNVASLIDRFYFEHHMHLKELANNWNEGMRGSVQQSLDLFTQVRNAGIAAHFWV